MDNITHSLAGWALGQAGLKTRSRKALAALILAANMPDIDVFFGWVPWTPLATHRGFTHGLVGGVLLITAFILLVRWGVGVGVRAEGRFSKLVAGGLATTIFFYVAINLMMVMGLAPVVGIPLPLISYGGSAVMTVMICLGLLMSFERQQRTSSRLS